MTRAKTERIAKYAFDFALKNNRKKVTIIHKANIMKMGDGLFLNVCREVGKKYEAYGIKTEDMIVDNASMQLVSKPHQFDVIVCGTDARRHGMISTAASLSHVMRATARLSSFRNVMAIRLNLSNFD